MDARGLRLLILNSIVCIETWMNVFSVRIGLCRSRDSVVGIATGYGLDDRGVGVRVPVGSRIFYCPRSPDRLWGPPNLLSIGGYWGLFPLGKAAGALSRPLTSS
jgi:hypothetical protein